MLVAITRYSPADAATIHVNTTQQGVTTGQCSLQEAIYSSEFKTNKAIGATDPDNFYTTGCEAGTGVDTIELPSNADFNFTQFWDGDAHNIFGPTATPVIFSAITIEGNGATLRWMGTGNSRLFAVATVNDPGFPSGTGNLTLRNVYIKGFHVKGGDGGLMGGGGGLGAGGAVYVATAFTVENTTFDSNGAVGGNGNTCGTNGDCNTGGIAGGGGAECRAMAATAKRAPQVGAVVHAAAAARHPPACLEWFKRVPGVVAVAELFSQAGMGPPMLKRTLQAALVAIVAVAAAEKPVMTARMRSVPAAAVVAAARNSITMPALFHVSVMAHRALLAVAAAVGWLMEEMEGTVAAAAVGCLGFSRYLAAPVVSAAGVAVWLKTSRSTSARVMGGSSAAMRPLQMRAAAERWAVPSLTITAR